METLIIHALEIQPSGLEQEVSLTLAEERNRLLSPWLWAVCETEMVFILNEKAVRLMVPKELFFGSKKAGLIRVLIYREADEGALFQLESEDGCTFEVQ